MQSSIKFSRKLKKNSMIFTLNSPGSRSLDETYLVTVRRCGGIISLHSDGDGQKHTCGNGHVTHHVAVWHQHTGNKTIRY